MQANESHGIRIMVDLRMMKQTLNDHAFMYVVVYTLWLVFEPP